LLKFSIVTPSLNQGEYIRNTIESVLSQDYSRVEYIVIDGGSTDNTLDIIKEYDRELSYWVSEADSGQAQAINKGFTHATGDVFSWLNSDDYYQVETLSRVAEYFESNLDTDLVSGQCKLLNMDGSAHISRPSPLRTYQDFLKIHSNWMNERLIIQPECFFRKRVYQNAGPLREDLEYCFDVLFWMRAAYSNYKFDSVPQHWATLRRHDGQKTNDLMVSFSELCSITWTELIEHKEVLAESEKWDIANDVFSAMKTVNKKNYDRYLNIDSSTSYQFGRLFAKCKFW